MTAMPAQIVVLTATCSLCHTLDTEMTAEDLRAGKGWSCARCGQRWDAQRLEAAAAYQRSVEAK